MGRTIIIEESVSDYISSLYGTHKWQIGLIIGQVGASTTVLTKMSENWKIVNVYLI